MATPHRTGRKAEVLWALPFVVDLAKDVLSKQEYESAEKTAIDLVRSNQTRDEALKPGMPADIVLPLDNDATREQP